MVSASSSSSSSVEKMSRRRERVEEVVVVGTVVVEVRRVEGEEGVEDWRGEEDALGVDLDRRGR
jgi:hypothetical protein